MATLEELDGLLVPLGWQRQEGDKYLAYAYIRIAGEMRWGIATSLPCRRSWSGRYGTPKGLAFTITCEDGSLSHGPLRVSPEDWATLPDKLQMLEGLIAQARKLPCPECDGSMVVRFRRRDTVAFFSCDLWPGCQGSRPTYEVGLEHQCRAAALRKMAGLPKPEMTCIKCGAPMRQLVARQGRYRGQRFWGCTRYPECRMIFRPEQARDLDEE